MKMFVVGSKIDLENGEGTIVYLPSYEKYGLFQDAEINYLSNSIDELIEKIDTDGEFKHLCYDNKFGNWVVTWEENNGVRTYLDSDNYEEVVELLKELNEKGIVNEYINVYPPSSNLTFKEFVEYKGQGR